MREIRGPDLVLGVGVVFATLAAVGALVDAVTRPPQYRRRPRLAEVVDGGKMAEFLESDAERAIVLRWVERGAPENGWSEVGALFEARCNTCHTSDETRFEVLGLDRYDTAAKASRIRPVLEEKITGGTMGEYLESAEEQGEILAWIERGAPESGWTKVEPILFRHCVQCHNPDGVAGIPSLDVYRTAARLATLPQPEPLPRSLLLGPAGLLSMSALGAIALWRRRSRAPR